MMTEIVADKVDFYRKMEKLLNAPAGSLKGSEPLSGLTNWDSLTILEFMILATSDYSLDVQPGDIADCKTIDDLAQLTLAEPAHPHLGA